mmetsp:Transcript_6048/g.20640  ORF Transcript_6048/g.20640 Transcript_6048/m.20640 type:complete len:225 (-) Transcript_6048:453-1127(-)
MSSPRAAGPLSGYPWTAAASLRSVRLCPGGTPSPRWTSLSRAGPPASWRAARTRLHCTAHSSRSSAQVAQRLASGPPSARLMAIACGRRRQHKKTARAKRPGTREHWRPCRSLTRRHLVWSQLPSPPHGPTGPALRHISQPGRRHQRRRQSKQRRPLPREGSSKRPPPSARGCAVVWRWRSSPRDRAKQRAQASMCSCAMPDALRVEASSLTPAPSSSSSGAGR